MWKLFLPTALILAFFAQSQPNFSGTWKYDPAGSTGEPAAKGASVLVITQSDKDITFDYHRGGSDGEPGDLVESKYVSTDGYDHAGNKNRTYTTYVKSYWQRKTLIVQTKGIMDVDGYQTFVLENRWTLSDDGKTLTDQSSDGTKTVYRRDTSLSE